MIITACAQLKYLSLQVVCSDNACDPVRPRPLSVTYTDSPANETRLACHEEGVVFLRLLPLLQLG